jgi:hypothetical protein
MSDRLALGGIQKFKQRIQARRLSIEQVRIFMVRLSTKVRQC